MNSSEDSAYVAFKKEVAVDGGNISTTTATTGPSQGYVITSPQKLPVKSYLGAHAGNGSGVSSSSASLGGLITNSAVGPGGVATMAGSDAPMSIIPTPSPVASSMVTSVGTLFGVSQGGNRDQDIGIGGGLGCSGRAIGGQDLLLAADAFCSMSDWDSRHGNSLNGIVTSMGLRPATFSRNVTGSMGDGSTGVGDETDGVLFEGGGKKQGSSGVRFVPGSLALVRSGASSGREKHSVNGVGAWTHTWPSSGGSQDRAMMLRAGEPVKRQG